MHEQNLSLGLSSDLCPGQDKHIWVLKACEPVYVNEKTNLILVLTLKTFVRTDQGKNCLAVTETQVSLLVSVESDLSCTAPSPWL